MQASEVVALARWAEVPGHGLVSFVGSENDQYEPLFQNAVLHQMSLDTGVPAIQFSTYYKAGAQDDRMQFCGGANWIQPTWNAAFSASAPPAPAGSYGLKTAGIAGNITKNVVGLRATEGFQVTGATYSASDTNPFAWASYYSIDEDETQNPLITLPAAGAKMYAYIGMAGSYPAGGGRVVIWGDEWLTYDTVWLNQDSGHTYSAATFWSNVITWLAPTCTPK
jgi:hypothetical protein